MFPLGDDNTARRSTPVVVYGLILVNVAVWLLQLTMGDPFTMGFSTVPYEITHGTDLVGIRRIEVGGEVHNLRHFAGPTPKAPQGNIQGRPRRLILGMPRKASPLSSTIYR
jgi:hypothetical protein